MHTISKHITDEDLQEFIEVTIRTNYKRHIVLHGWDEIYQTCLIGCWTRLKTYDPEISALTTYLTMVIKYELSSKPMRKLLSKMDVTDSMHSKEDSVNTADEPTIECDKMDMIVQKELEVIVVNALSSKPRLVKVMLMHLNDDNLKTIGEHFGFSHQRACQLLKEAKDRIKRAVRLQSQMYL